MENELNLGEVIQRFTADDELTLRVIDDLQGQDFMRAQRYSRTDARNAFFRIAGTNAVSIVCNHARLEESAVIMPLHMLAQIMTQVVHSAQEQRTPMSTVFRSLRPVSGEVATLRLDTDERAHSLYRSAAE